MTHLSITKGTKETLLLDIEDELENLTTLTTAACTFDIKDRSGAFKMQDVPVVVDGAKPLRARCLVDTTLGGLWSAGKYFLYVKFTATPDLPVIGPFEFSVNP